MTEFISYATEFISCVTEYISYATEFKTGEKENLYYNKLDHGEAREKKID